MPAECTSIDAEKAELRHPFDSVPLLFVQVMFGLGVWYGYQLLKHPSVHDGGLATMANAKPPTIPEPAHL